MPVYKEALQQTQQQQLITTYARSTAQFYPSIHARPRAQFYPGNIGFEDVLRSFRLLGESAVEEVAVLIAITVALCATSL